MNPEISARTKENQIFKIFESYGVACIDLWNLSNSIDKNIPKTPIGIGMIGEYYVNFYLKYKYLGQRIEFAPSNQKGWDLILYTESCFKYQVKSISYFNKSRRLKLYRNHFDYLIVIVFDLGMFPYDVYKFSSEELFSDGLISKSITIPSKGSKRSTGSKFIKENHNITHEFLEKLEFDCINESQPSEQ